MSLRLPNQNVLPFVLASLATPLFRACTGRHRAGGGDGDAGGTVELRSPGGDRFAQRGADPGSEAEDQYRRIPRSRARHGGAEPRDLRAGTADRAARIRRPVPVRGARHQADRRRHPGQHPRRSGRFRPVRLGLGQAHRGSARSILGAVRQSLRRRGADLHRGRPGAADALRRHCRGQLRFLAHGSQVRWPVRQPQLHRQPVALRDGRLPPVERSAEGPVQRQADAGRRTQVRPGPWWRTIWTSRTTWIRSA